MGLTIREIADDDVRGVIALWHESGLTRPWNDPEADVVNARTTSTSTILVGSAEPAGAILGTVMAGFDGHRGWLYYLAVAPSARGRGFGRDLVIAAEAWLAGQGAGKAQLMVRGANRSVIEFYERLGYTDQECVVLGRRFD